VGLEPLNRATLAALSKGCGFQECWLHCGTSNRRFTGADADHIQVKRGPDGLARAKHYLTAARYYSFYTLDVADMVDYEALKTTVPW
jgi:hypothetical protein